MTRLTGPILDQGSWDGSNDPSVGSQELIGNYGELLLGNSGEILLGNASPVPLDVPIPTWSGHPEYAGPPPAPTYAWYVDGMFWTTTHSGTINNQAFRPGAKIIARGNPDSKYLPLSEVRFLVSNALPTTFYIPFGESVIFASGPPDASIIEEFGRQVVNVERRLDIYENDGVTLFQEDVAMSSGSVTADMTRSERRNFEVELDDDRLQFGPGEFWYDKILRPWRGIRLSDGTVWLTPLGTFYPDTIRRPRFPSNISATCRDGSKKLSQVGFADVPGPTTFAAGLNAVEVMKAIAINGGVNTVIAEPSDDTLGEDTTYLPEDLRWEALRSIAESISYEVYFDAFEALIIAPWVDPVTAPVSFSFATGPINGNLADFGRSTNDARLRNDIIVRGDSESNALVYGRATNTDNSTPTSVDNVGRRERSIPNQLVKSNAAALRLAQAYLKVSALEQYDLSLTSIMIPWLEVGTAVEADLPDAAPTDPSRFLLSSVTIPLELGSMTASTRRVINLG